MQQFHAIPNFSFFISGLSPFLQRCLELADRPGAAVAPNPRVGAVVVHEGRIIGEGAHTFYGGPHAEVNAIRSVEDKSLLKESTLYVSLEPCNHHGKTPPCTDLILASGIPRVVVGSVDPNPLMQGHSIAHLRAQGVAVQVEEDASAFIALNKHFWLNQKLRRPYIVLKWAASDDGFIAGFGQSGMPEPRAISGAAVNRSFHWLRHDLQAIMIGKNTAAIDNPSLTTRHWPGRNPLRIVLDRQLTLERGLTIFTDGGQTIVINDLEDKQDGALQFWKMQDSRNLEALMAALYATHQIGSILVEGGRDLLQQFIALGLWDEIYCATSPAQLYEGIPAPILPSALSPQWEGQIGPDTVRWYHPASLAK